MAILPRNDETLTMSRYAAPIVGRLIAMPTTPTDLGAISIASLSGFSKTTSFDFPSMPDVIELARSTDYLVNTSPFMPDGMHTYRSTRPLEIPLSFALHAYDKTYCKYGALTLLQLAARLHSFVLPITRDGQPGSVTSVTVGDIIKARTVQGTDIKALTASVRKEYSVAEGLADNVTVRSASSNSDVQQLTSKGGKSGGNPPVTCLLHLMYVAEDQPGISCIGYIKDVRVRLKGPWMLGPNGSFNLPSSGEYEFTFVHRPSHSNNWGQFSDSDNSSNQASVEDSHAYATDVRDKLYNTRNLVLRANWNGMDSTGAGGSDVKSIPERGTYDEPALPIEPGSGAFGDVPAGTSPIGIKGSIVWPDAVYVRRD